MQSTTIRHLPSLGSSAADFVRVAELRATTVVAVIVMEESTRAP